MKIALLIPARDEENTIADVVHDFGESFAQLGRNTDIYIIDDLSKDRTVQRAREAGASILQPTHGSGLANAFRFGTKTLLDREYNTIVHVDADGQYSVEDLPNLLDRHDQTGGLVVGNRIHQRPSGMSEARFRWNHLMSELVSAIAGREIPDSQSGFRVFSDKVARDCTIVSDFTYTQEQIIRAAQNGFECTHCPIRFKPRQHGGSRLARSPLYYLHRTLQDLDRLRDEYQVNLESGNYVPGEVLKWFAS